jgi:carboxymethylenebutenolidase
VVIKRIVAPVYGFYAENDARVNSTIDASQEAMQAAGKTFEPKTYAGGGHGFMRAGEDPGGSESNKSARAGAWERLRMLLKKLM